MSTRRSALVSLLVPVALCASLSGCGQNGAKQQAVSQDPDLVGSVKSADTVSAFTGNLFVEQANTAPAGAYLAQTQSRYVAYADKNTQLIHIMSSPLPDPTFEPGATGGPPALSAPGPASADPQFSNDVALTWNGPQILGADKVNDSGGVSMTAFNGQLYLAFNGTDRQINIESSPDGSTWTKQVVSNATSPYAPAITVHQGRLVVAYTGEGPGELNVFSSPDGNFQGDANLDQKFVLGQQSQFAPGLASFNDSLYIAWTGFPGGVLGLGTNPDLNLAVIGDFGQSGFVKQATAHTLNLDSDDGPALIGFGSQLIMSWRGSGNTFLNYNTFDQSQLDQDFASGDITHGGQTITLSKAYNTDHTPVIAYFGPAPGLNDLGQATMIWKDEGTSHVDMIENLFFNNQTICVDGSLTSPDTDGDGLLDCWEDEGIDFNGDGIIDLDLPGKGANKNVPDAFVEADYFDCTKSGSDCPAGDNHNHKPDPAAIALVEARFQAQGIHLVIEPDEALPHQATCAFEGQSCQADSSCFGQIRTSNFGTVSQRADSNQLAAKKLAYHYALWVHNIGPNLLGQACICGPDFTVGMGQPVTPPNSFFEGLVAMHEFGHNLNLHHGGFEDLNFKPNYMSIMNYGIGQNGGLRSDSTAKPTPVPILDYSHSQLPALLEQTGTPPGQPALSESIGIQDGPFFTVFTCPNATLNTQQPANGPIDWACDGTPPAKHGAVANDINGDRWCVSPSNCASNPSPTCGQLQTSSTSNDDLFMGGHIDPPKGGFIATTVSISDGIGFNSNGDAVIVPGPTGILFSMANLTPPDVAVGVQIADGSDFTCDTTAKAGTTDGQTRPVGNVETSLLQGFDDWSNVHFDWSLQRNHAMCKAAGVGELGEKPADIVLQNIHQQFAAQGSADLGVTGSASFGSSLTGSTVTLTYTVTSAGPDHSGFAALDLPLPSGSSAVSCNGGPCKIISNTAVVPLGVMTSGQTETVTIVASVGCTIATGSIVTFNAKVADTSADPNPTNNTSSIPVTVGSRPQDFTVLGTNGVQINDGAILKTASGALALIGETGSPIAVNIGNLTQIGSIDSVAPVFLGSGNHVAGSITSDGAVTQGLLNTIAGPVLQHQSITVPGLPTSIAFPPSNGDVTVGTGASRTLAPGSYGKISASPFGHLTLVAGTYYATSFDVQLGATATLDKTAGAITLNVLNEMTLLSAFQEVGSVASGSDFLLQYFSLAPQVFTLTVPFSGTLVAPNTFLVLGPILGGGHKGVFMAKNLTVSPQTTVTRRPFDPACN